MPLYPDHNYNAFNIMSIDPGAHKTGVAIFSFTGTPHQLNTLDAFTIKTDSVADGFGLDLSYWTERDLRLLKLSQVIDHYLRIYRPINVVTEGPFYNRFTPAAYASLVEVVRILALAVQRFDPNIYFYSIQPKAVKKTFGSKQSSQKNDMKDALLSKPFLLERLCSNVNLLDEHAIDAIGVGYTHLVNYGILRG